MEIYSLNNIYLSFERKISTEEGREEGVISFYKINKKNKKIYLEKLNCLLCKKSFAIEDLQIATSYCGGFTVHCSKCYEKIEKQGEKIQGNFFINQRN